MPEIETWAMAYLGKLWQIITPSIISYDLGISFLMTILERPDLCHQTCPLGRRYCRYVIDPPYAPRLALTADGAKFEVRTNAFAM